VKKDFDRMLLPIGCIDLQDFYRMLLLIQLEPHGQTDITVMKCF
jgi:hypothetical protein